MKSSLSRWTTHRTTKICSTRLPTQPNSADGQVPILMNEQNYIILKDSLLNGIQWEAIGNKKGTPGNALKALEALDKQYKEGKVNIIRLLEYRNNSDLLCPITYSNIEIEKISVTDFTVYTSHYIGRCRINETDISINPRFGEKVFNYLLSYATGLYVPQGESSFEKNKSNSYWLLTIIWKAMLNRAITQGHVPKEYVTETRNLKHYHGRLNLQKHIRANMCDASRFYCTYRKLTPNTTINRTIRYTYKLLMQKKMGYLLNDFTSYDRKLASFGVDNNPVEIHEIDHIRYARLNAAYKPLMELCRTLIACRAAEGKEGTAQADVAYFIDVADLWEMYLLRLLQNQLPGYHVFSPNATSGDFLLENRMREIRPDILIEKDGQTRMVIDAKYKDYETFGRTAQEPNCVQRDDLYQMSTYLYHYGTENEPITGIFCSPVKTATTEGELFTLQHDSNHRIGLVNLSLDNGNNKDDDEVLTQVKKAEESFIKRIRELLETSA